MFRHPEDRLPVALICALFAVDLSVYFFVEHPLIILAYAGLSMLPKAGICAFNHHHQHVSTFHYAWANRLLEFVYVLQTGVSSQAWVLHHSLGHHLHYLDQTKDESRWAREDGSRMGEWEYAWKTTITAYPRAWGVSAKHPRQRKIFLVMGLISIALISALVAYKPLAGSILFLVLPVLMLFGTALATWAHHSDRGTADDFDACNNILQPFYNTLTGNLGYHTAHHHRPGMHWSMLPKLHAELESKIPADAFREPGIPWKWFGASPRAVAPGKSVEPRVTSDQPPVIDPAR
ncbi:MAG: fatty acid desaturase [Archangium sp.]|nr:fatty acid desaturase [Archangium sp.]